MIRRRIARLRRWLAHVLDAPRHTSATPVSYSGSSTTTNATSATSSNITFTGGHDG